MSDEKIPEVLYKYYPPERWKNVFEDWTIRFTPPSEFNDPFECKPCYTKLFKGDPPSEQEIDVNCAELAKVLARKNNTKYRYINNRSAMISSTLHTKNALKEIVLKATDNGGEWVLSVIKKFMIQDVKILSLAQNCYNLLMWAHYSESHKGFIIGIKSNSELVYKHSEKNKRSVSPEKVIYSEKRPSGHVEGPGETLEGYYLTKGKSWDYEEEWRVWATEGSDERFSWVKGGISGVHELKPRHLAVVIFGAYMPETKVKDCCRRIRSQPDCVHIKLQRARLHESRYELVIEDIDPSFYEK